MYQTPFLQSPVELISEPVCQLEGLSSPWQKFYFEEQTRNFWNKQTKVMKHKNRQVWKRPTQQNIKRSWWQFIHIWKAHFIGAVLTKTTQHCYHTFTMSSIYKPETGLSCKCHILRGTSNPNVKISILLQLFPVFDVIPRQCTHIYNLDNIPHN